MQTQNHLPQIFLNLLLWEVTTLLTYTVSRLSFLPIICSSRCTPYFSKCCIMHGNVFEVSHSPRTEPERRVTIRFIMLYSLAVFFLGNKYNQLNPLNNSYTLLYPLISPITAFIMAYMSNVKGLQTSCSLSSIKHWPIISWLVYGTVFLIAVPTYIYNLYYIYISEGVYTLSCYFIFIALIAIFEFALYKLYDPTHTVHIHHLYIGTIGATLYRANSPYVVPISFALYGIGIEGATNYGFPDIFENHT